VDDLAIPLIGARLGNASPLTWQWRHRGREIEGEMHMMAEKAPYNLAFLEEMRKLLLQAKAWREQGIEVGDREIIEYIGGVNAGIDQHQADDATAVYEQELAFTLRNTLAGSLTQVEDALRAIDEGTYGRCEKCGDWIDPARLRALPFTDLCIHCASRESADFTPPRY